MGSFMLALLASGLLLVLCHWYRGYKAVKSYQEATRVIRVKARSTAFANNYRVWKWVYREILDVGDRNNVDN